MSSTMKDPVCGAPVDPTFTSRRHTIDDVEYYFCSDACMTRFMSDPVRFVSPGQVP